MKRLMALLVLFSLVLASPVRAGMIMEYDTMDKSLDKKKQFEQDMSRDFKKLAQEPVQPTEKSSSSWWKWTLGLLVVGGVAVAAGGGKGGDSGGGSTSGGSGSGTITGTW